jgi:hypothetical protein
VSVISSVLFSVPVREDWQDEPGDVERRVAATARLFLAERSLPDRDHARWMAEQIAEKPANFILSGNKNGSTLVWGGAWNHFDAKQPDEDPYCLPWLARFLLTGLATDVWRPGYRALLLFQQEEHPERTRVMEFHFDPRDREFSGERRVIVRERNVDVGWSRYGDGSWDPAEVDEPGRVIELPPVETT